MTEAEWLACDEPRTMLSVLDDRTSRRRLRLLACGCCHRIGARLTVRAAFALDVAERYADQRASDDECDAAHESAYQEYDWPEGSADPSQTSLAVSWAARIREDGVYPPRYAQIVLENACRLSAAWVAGATLTKPQLRERAEQCDVIRDIFGIPFRPVAFSLGWRTSTAVALAQGVYESRAFSAMPILADALQDAGCDVTDILDHCREPGEHVRGCWVVDLVLGKS